MGASIICERGEHTHGGLAGGGAWAVLRRARCCSPSAVRRWLRRRARHCRLEELVADTRLAAGCTYPQGVVIARPLTLDCRGAVFDGEGKALRGLTIDSRGEPLAGVTVRNCTFRRFARHGVLIHWGLANDRKLARYPAREEAGVARRRTSAWRTCASSRTPSSAS